MNNIKIRQATIEDAAEIANVHINSWREAYKGLMPQSFLDERPLNFKSRYTLWKRVIPDTTFITIVAESTEHGIVGFINGKEGREDHLKDQAEVWCIYLLQKYHGQKIGLELMKKYFNEMKAKGFVKAYLWVLKDNPTIEFYEKTGGKYTGDSKVDAIAGQSITELCYAWESLDLERKDG